MLWVQLLTCFIISFQAVGQVDLPNEKNDLSASPINYEAIRSALVNERDSIDLGIKFWKCGLTCETANVQILETLKQYLLDHPTNTYQIESYTDCRGGEFENVALSLQRSEMIRDWLAEQGIVKEQIVAKGYGGRRQRVACICESCTPTQHAANRRVVLRLIDIFSNDGLADRLVLEKPWLRKEAHFKGVVAVRTCIDAQGKVTSVVLDEVATTATDADYRQKVLAIAKEWNFSPAARELQCGMLVYDFEQ